MSKQLNYQVKQLEAEFYSVSKSIETAQSRIDSVLIEMASGQNTVQSMHDLALASIDLTAARSSVTVAQNRTNFILKHFVKPRRWFVK